MSFFRSTESKIESSGRSVADSASRVFHSGYKAVTERIDSGAVIVQQDAADLAKRITSAKNWPELKFIAEFVLGDASFELGVCVGVVEHLGGDVVGILGLLKTLVFAGLYEQAHTPWYLAGPGYPVAKGVELILGDQMKQADDRCKAMLQEVWEIIKHPIDFVEGMGGRIKAETVAKWKELMQLSQKPGLANSFQEGRIVGGVLYEIVMAILLVISVAGAAAKLAAKVPALVEAVRGLGFARDAEEAAAVGRLGEVRDAIKSSSKAGELTQEASVTKSRGKNTATWFQDSQGRTIRVEAKLRETFSGLDRSSAEIKAQKAAAAAGEEGDVGGHVLGHRFIGNQGEMNLFPQEANFNNSAYRTMENELADWTKNGKQVDVTIKLEPPGAGRPDLVSVKYRVTDPATGKELYSNAEEFNNESGQVFQRMPASEMKNF